MLDHAHTPSHSPPVVLMDVAREHFDEGVSMLSRWNRALERFDYSYESIARGPEHRFVAHVEGLVRGGRPVLEALVMPALHPYAPNDLVDPNGPCTLAALVALLEATPDAPDQVVEAMQALTSEQRRAVLRAFTLWDDPRASPWLEAMVRRADPSSLAGWLGVAADRWMNVPESVLDRALQQDEPELVATAMRILARTKHPFDPSAIEARLSHPHHAVRSAALAAGLVRGSRVAWPLAVEQALDPTTPIAGELVAMLGAPSEQAELIGWAAQPDAPEHALWCLSLIGRIEAADVAAARLCDPRPRIAKLAFTALRLVCGPALDEPRFVDRLPLPEGTSPPEDPWADPVDALPLPDVDAVRRHWQRHRARLEPERRCLLGGSYTTERIAYVQHECPAGYRHALALELAVRSRGACQIPTRTWTWIQRDAIQTAGSFRFDFDRPYQSPFSTLD
ncbi:hypothetical protein [Paraliomyxa miuraensis]|uniref:hypothetical protein n=1 Tax=Paraliomyxa miuraensis TaxID=376150 RepID=UPI002250CA73|nr:hypothetical protein [Paraliomyxa miuraensis]MCX4240341.1 hypothetical protein [Paraliomyxa miuraensis]